MARTKRKRRLLRYRGVNLRADRDHLEGLSPWWRRVVAYPLDTVVVLVISSGLLGLLDEHPYFTRHVSAEEALVRLGVVIVAATVYYPPPCVGRMGGQSESWLCASVSFAQTGWP